MKVRRTFISLLLLLVMLSATPGHTATMVTVKLRVAKVTYLQPVATCSVSVPQGSDGVAVLNAAKGIGCIQSFTLITFGLGSFVDCINGTCTESVAPYRFWAMRDTARPAGVRTPLCPSTDYGVNDFYADQGDELSFTYETLATSMVPGVCPA